MKSTPCLLVLAVVAVLAGGAPARASDIKRHAGCLHAAAKAQGRRPGIVTAGEKKYSWFSGSRMVEGRGDTLGFHFITLDGDAYFVARPKSEYGQDSGDQDPGMRGKRYCYKIAGGPFDENPVYWNHYPPTKADHQVSADPPGTDAIRSKCPASKKGKAPAQAGTLTAQPVAAEALQEDMMKMLGREFAMIYKGVYLEAMNRNSDKNTGWTYQFTASCDGQTDWIRRAELFSACTQPVADDKTFRAEFDHWLYAAGTIRDPKNDQNARSPNPPDFKKALTAQFCSAAP